ncbi:hypothetical protein CEXT_300541 [Caerostris extrusa]|uniref:Uncharacterized protein n=1 Tax=Caerostris extrusa TaxID=172846 RepID=A0AAV4PYC6_CAEEX|nr:hypothetical protein CEXT_300541 [Caerostris extrusa]
MSYLRTYPWVKVSPQVVVSPAGKHGAPHRRQQGTSAALLKPLALVKMKKRNSKKKDLSSDPTAAESTWSLFGKEPIHPKLGKVGRLVAGCDGHLSSSLAPILKRTGNPLLPSGRGLAPGTHKSRERSSCLGALASISGHRSPKVPHLCLRMERFPSNPFNIRAIHRRPSTGQVFLPRAGIKCLQNICRARLLSMALKCQFRMPISSRT